MPTDQEFLTLMAEGGLARAMARRFGLRNPEEVQAAEVACARLHNTGAWDFLRVVEGGQFQSLPTSDFFSASHSFNAILPELDADASRVMGCVECLVGMVLLLGDVEVRLR